MAIELSSKIGFCSGVRRAYQLVKKNYKSYPKPVQILGDLVHNTHVIQETKKWGIKKIDNIDQAWQGTVIITAHGVDPKVIQRLKAKKIKVLNAICPKVSRVIAKARFLALKGRTVLIFGDKTHSEVRAINGSINKKALVFASVKELSELAQDINKETRLGLVSQTTRNITEFKEIKKFLRQNFSDLKIYNTICSATYHRQRQAREKAGQADQVVVIGSPFSANSKELYKICKKNNPATYFIDKPEQVQDLNIKPNQKIWVCTGASIPDPVIHKVVQALQAKIEK
ncbi:MAG: 4-hydroxy-3-methylbut-2-enyl diphosphate reductase [Candidatus Moranbacteria bacterium]|nr:4-hydroxy-3-methylbut-2-enyl diphosphate reductase [Candidatus Moranbacteria bacterium]